MDSPAKLTVSNQKGGVGKTTIAVHLSGALAQRGHDVLLVDTDPQGNATSNLGHEDYFSDLSIDVTLGTCLTNDEHADKIEQTIAEAEEFDLVRANEQMNEGLRTDLNSVNAPEQRLTHALENVEDEYDYIIIDAPPSLDKITTNALVYSENILVPTYPEVMSAGGLSILSDHVESLQNYYPAIGYLGFVANRVESNKEADQVIDQFETTFGGSFPLWKVRKRVVLRRAITESNGSIFIHDEDDEFALTFFDMATWLDDYFGVESDVELDDVFSKEDLRDAVIHGQISPEGLEQLGDDVENRIERRA
jgi:chromosome partitioning protein